MANETNRREFVQSAGLAAPVLIAAASPLTAAVPETGFAALTTMGARLEDAEFAAGKGPNPVTHDKTIGNSGVGDDPLEIPR